MSMSSSCPPRIFTINFYCDAVDLYTYKKIITFLEALEQEFVGHYFNWIYDDEKQILLKTERDALIRSKISTNEQIVLASNNNEDNYLAFSGSNSGPTPTLDSSHHFSFDVQLSENTEWIHVSPDFIAYLGDLIDARFGFAGNVSSEVYAVKSYNPTIREKYYDAVHQNVKKILADYPEFASLPKLRPFNKLQFPNFAPITLQWMNYWSPKTCDLLRFPNIPDDQRWMTHSQKTKKGAWVVCLTESPLDISSAQDRQILVDAYQRFYTN